ncbi:hypothetical protein WISP_118908 [Willisornis vidua]|uniref:Uncharacterized protein n=1 Tax=Willisornis vidua TaxID=1566151 RepID=A0ABQ9CY32_9PASS|nr:hypothetical protein WISP_118908 [Willisornis vidua]
MLSVAQGVIAQVKAFKVGWLVLLLHLFRKWAAEEFLSLSDSRCLQRQGNSSKPIKEETENSDLIPVQREQREKRPRAVSEMKEQWKLIWKHLQSLQVMLRQGLSDVMPPCQFIPKHRKSQGGIWLLLLWGFVFLGGRIPSHPGQRIPSHHILARGSHPILARGSHPILARGSHPILARGSHHITSWPEDHIPSWPEDPIPSWPEDPIPSWPEDPIPSWPGDHITSWPEDPITSHPGQRIPSYPGQGITSHPGQGIPSHPGQRIPSHPILARGSHPILARGSHPTLARGSHPILAKGNKVGKGLWFPPWSCTCLVSGSRSVCAKFELYHELGSTNCFIGVSFGIRVATDTSFVIYTIDIF